MVEKTKTNHKHDEKQDEIGARAKPAEELNESGSALAERRALRKIREAALEQELAVSGVRVKSYRHIIERPENYKIAIPIIIRHMQMDIYPELTRNAMAQSIAMKEANPYWDTLLEVFQREATRLPIFAQGVAVALSKCWEKPQLRELIDLCMDDRYGDLRVLLANGLRRTKDARAENALMTLASDPQIGSQITKWIKNKSRGSKPVH